LLHLFHGEAIFARVYTVSREQKLLEKNTALVGKVRGQMLLPVVLVGLALFALAFVGINKFVPTLIGLASVIGLIFGIYLLWLGFSANSENRFIWGFLLLLASGGVLVYLKTAFSD